MYSDDVTTVKIMHSGVIKYFFMRRRIVIIQRGTHVNVRAIDAQEKNSFIHRCWSKLANAANWLCWNPNLGNQKGGLNYRQCQRCIFKTSTTRG